jgi:ATP-dependent Lhr-like helicase
VNSRNPSLLSFHPLIAQWFEDDIGQPTDIQRQAWPPIIAGEHVLISAPTGSGKTLTAFLWTLNQLVTGVWARGRTHVLYVSPLKALNTDIRRNLLKPLAELKEVFQEKGEVFPEIRVQTRSGDTPQVDRRRMLHHPPEILITTPESLNLLLSSQGGRSILGCLSVVILDEIHTVLNNKRGVHLITAVDRLVSLSGEFQRIAISATVKPMSTVAAYVAGLKMEGDAASPQYVPREMKLLRSEAPKKYDLNVRLPEAGSEPGPGETIWEPLVRDFRDIIKKNRSSLFFARSRRLSERITFKINAAGQSPIAYAHHGSLSKELRLEVENKLKAGALKAIVATNSLELGIDIGSLDEVILVQSPPSISSAVQRIGRAGHGVEETSRGTLYPTHDQDYVESAVIARAVKEGDIEEARPVAGALDVLAQIVISMVGTRTWDIDALFAQLRSSWPYRNLSRPQFDLVLNMLAGRYADTRIRELKPRISLDRLDNTVSARRGALLQLYISGGTIPDRGYYHLRHEQTNAQIGELDEEFVWEARIGQTFTLGTQHWKIRRITHNDVVASPVVPKTLEAPFWKAEVFNRGFFLSQKIGLFLEEADSRLDDPEWQEELQSEYRLDPPAARRVLDYLNRQKNETGCSLPHRHHVLTEFVQSGPGGVPGTQTVLHLGWGGRVNRPLALALESAWEEQHGQRLEIFAGDDSIVLQLPDAATAEDLLGLVTPANLETHLRQRLETSGYFGARFRECAGRALLLVKRKLNERMPLWMSRMRSQKLLQSVMRHTDFPILLETWRTCLQDEFDLDALCGLLEEIASGTIRISECTTSHPSPMASGLTWAQINQYMYAGDALPTDKPSRLRTDLLREVVLSPGLRPAVPEEIIREFELKRQRLYPGYAPATARELVDWVKERVLIPEQEWKELLTAVERDLVSQNPGALEALLEEAGTKLVRLVSPQAGPLTAALERLEEIRLGLCNNGLTEVADLSPETAPGNLPGAMQPTSEPEKEGLFVSLLSEWLQFYGPRSPQQICSLLGLELGSLQPALEDLCDGDVLIAGTLVEGIDTEGVCDAENFEILLRMARAAAAPRVEPKAIEELQPFLAGIQGLMHGEDSADGLYSALERLVGYPLPAPLWEAEIFPARFPGYTIDWLDSLLRQGSLRWLGDRDRRIRFLFEEDFPLLPQEERPEEESKTDPRPDPEALDAAALFSDPAARYDFSALLTKVQNRVRDLEDRLWSGVWGGEVTNDTFSSLRRGLQTRFRVAEAVEKQRKSQRRHGNRTGRLHLSRWKETHAYPGSWLLLPRASSIEAPDLMELEERLKDRVRILLDRYGILFRELLHREPPGFRWGDVFRTLRLMELSGEIHSGYFFQDIPGPQFMSPRALRLFQQKHLGDQVYWLNALDPASLCGIPLEALRGRFPKRIPTNHLVFCGRDLILVSRRQGRELNVLIPPENTRLSEALTALRHLLHREFSPMRRINLETINDAPAGRSPYLSALEKHFDVVKDVQRVSLYRKTR